MDSVKLQLYADSKKYTLNKILSFKFTKNIFESYTFLNITISAGKIYTYEFDRCTFFINNIQIHDGYIDTVKSYKKNGIYFLNIISKGFSALLMQNYLKPGLYSGVSLNQLMTDYMALPNVTHEDNSTTVNYIYVRDGDCFWDGISSLAYKLNQTFPFISGLNQVNVSVPTSDTKIIVNDSSVIENGFAIDYREIFSDIYMQDTDGQYDKFSLHVDEAESLNIVRRREIELDKRFLSDPIQSLYLRKLISLRKKSMNYIKYNGFMNAELYNVLSYGDLNGNIKSIIIQGTKNGITTEIYYD
jgi:hypothetical protein